MRVYTYIHLRIFCEKKFFPYINLILLRSLINSASKFISHGLPINSYGHVPFFDRYVFINLSMATFGWVWIPPLAGWLAGWVAGGRASDLATIARVMGSEPGVRSHLPINDGRFSRLRPPIRVAMMARDSGQVGSEGPLVHGRSPWLALR